MKKLLLVLLLIVFMAQPCLGALDPSIDNKHTWKNAYRFTGKPKDLFLDWCIEVEEALDGTDGVSFLLLDPDPGTAPAVAAEGQLYYKASSNTLYFHNGSGWVELAASTASSLDSAYNSGNTIDVDGSAVTLDNDTTDNNVLLILTQDDTTGNTDAMTIVNTNTGDAIQISGGATTGGGINVIGYAASTVPLITCNSTTNNMNLADNVGQITIASDAAYAHKGAAGLVVYHQTGQPVTAAEGFLARFVSSGTARAASYAVGITVPATQPAMAVNSQVIITGQGNSSLTTLNVVGNDGTNNTHALDLHNEGTAAAMLITPDDVDTPALLITGKADSTVTVVSIDGDTGDWKGGADDVAMVEILGGATANANAGGGLLAVISTTTPASGSEGFLARFIHHTGTATTNAHAVEIETVNTQPALMLNNKLTITGAAASGTLVAISHSGASGNADGITVGHTGTGAALQITLGEADSQALELISHTSGTQWVQYIDGITSGWIGADDVGMLTLKLDTAGGDAGSTALFLQTVASPTAASEGFLVRLEQKTGAAVTDAYAMGIKTTATTPCLHLNNELVITGIAASGTLMTITNADATADTVVLVGVGSGEVLQINPNATTATGLEVLTKANATVALVNFDGSTAAWVGAADDVSMVNVIGSGINAHIGGSLLRVASSAIALSNSEGFLARFISSGNARTDATAVEIEVPATQPALAVNGITKINGQDAAGAAIFQVAGVGASGNADAMTISNTGTGDCLQISPGGTTTAGLNLVGLANSTVSQALFDGATATWLGADNVGQVMITSDTAYTDTGATSLLVRNNGTMLAASEGFLARFVQDTGAAVTDAYAVEIEVTSTTPAFYANGQVSIVSPTGNTGVMFDVTGTDATIDTAQFTGIGSGDVVQITSGATTAIGLNVIGYAAQTVSNAIFDAATSDWGGATGVGMVHIKGDAALLHADASLLYVHSVTGTPIVAADGFLAKFIDASSARASSYAVNIESTNNEALHTGAGKVQVDEILTTTIGYQAIATARTSAADGGAVSVIAKGTRIVNVSAQTTNDNDWVLLPSGAIGEQITIIATVACEVRTPAASDDLINNVDADGGANELALVAGDILHLICVTTAGEWIGHGTDHVGAAKTMTPHAN